MPKMPICPAAPYEAHTFFHASLLNLGRFSVFLVRLNLAPVGHVAALSAVELFGNAVVTSWALTPIVLFGFHGSSCRIPTLGKQQTVHPVRCGILLLFGVTTDSAVSIPDRTD
jgi:hypothetical protein